MPPLELDIENIWWPDAVPQYLLEREGYYGIHAPKTSKKWWMEHKTLPAVDSKWWHQQVVSHQCSSKPVIVKCNDVNESSSDPEIVDLPPDR